MALLEMKKVMALGAILCVSLTVLLVACSKEYDCECLVNWHVTGETHTISMGTGEKECRSLGFSDVVSHVGGNATDASEYSVSCYEK